MIHEARLLAETQRLHAARIGAEGHEPAIAVYDVIPRQRERRIATIDLADPVIELGVVDGGGVRVRRKRLVPDADQRKVPPGNDEHMPRFAPELGVAIPALALHREREPRFRAAPHGEASIPREGPTLPRAETRVAGKQILRARTRRIEDELCADLDLLAAQAVSGPDADDAIALPKESVRFDIVACRGTGLDRGLHERQHQPRRAVHLAVVEDGGAREVPIVELRVQVEQFRAAEQARERDPARAVRDAGITVEREEVVEVHAGAEKRLALAAAAIDRNDDRQRGDEVGCDAQQRASFPARGAQSRNIQVLEIANPAVNDLETLGGGAAAEIVALDQHRAQAAQRRVPQGGRAECATAYDCQIELT